MPTKEYSAPLDGYLAILDTNVRIPLKEAFEGFRSNIEADESFEMPLSELLHDIFNPKNTAGPSGGWTKEEIDKAAIPHNDDYMLTFLIDHVKFNPPATIIFWKDGTKTVVKCSPKDAFDEEKGIALCYMKKLFGNTGYFNEVLKRWVPTTKEEGMK